MKVITVNPEAMNKMPLTAHSRQSDDLEARFSHWSSWTKLRRASPDMKLIYYTMSHARPHFRPNATSNQYASMKIDKNQTWEMKRSVRTRNNYMEWGEKGDS